MQDLYFLASCVVAGAVTGLTIVRLSRGFRVSITRGPAPPSKPSLVLTAACLLAALVLLATAAINAIQPDNDQPASKVEFGEPVTY